MASAIVDEVISTASKYPLVSPRAEEGPPGVPPPFDLADGNDSDFIESQEDLSVMSESVPGSPPGGEVDQEDISEIKSPRDPDPVPEDLSPESVPAPVPAPAPTPAPQTPQAPAPAPAPAAAPLITPAAQKFIDEADARASRANARFAAADIELQQIKEKYEKLMAEETAEHLELEKVGMERDILKRDVVEKQAKNKVRARHPCD